MPGRVSLLRGNGYGFASLCFASTQTRPPATRCLLVSLSHSYTPDGKQKRVIQLPQDKLCWTAVVPKSEKSQGVLGDSVPPYGPPLHSEVPSITLAKFPSESESGLTPMKPLTYLLSIAVFLLGGLSSHASSGTGFYISPNKIMTCAHCLTDTLVYVDFPDGKKTMGFVERKFEKEDVAIVSTIQKSANYLQFGKASTLALLADVYVYGYPLGENLGKELTAAKGSLNARRNGDDLLQIDAVINPGNSGGPVLSNDGLVIGMVNAKVTGAERIGFAISSETILRLNIEGLQASSSPSERSIAEKATVMLTNPVPIPKLVDTKKLTSMAFDHIIASNSDDISDEMRLYSDVVVSYFGEGTKTRKQIYADRVAYRKRWPIRMFAPVQVCDTNYNKELDAFRAVVKFTYVVSNGSRTATGIGVQCIVFEHVSTRPSIVGVDEVTKKN